MYLSFYQFMFYVVLFVKCSVENKNLLIDPDFLLRCSAIRWMKPSHTNLTFLWSRNNFTLTKHSQKKLKTIFYCFCRQFQIALSLTGDLQKVESWLRDTNKAGEKVTVGGAPTGFLFILILRHEPATIKK